MTYCIQRRHASHNYDYLNRLKQRWDDEKFEYNFSLQISEYITQLNQPKHFFAINYLLSADWLPLNQGAFRENDIAILDKTSYEADKCILDLINLLHLFTQGYLKSELPHPNQIPYLENLKISLERGLAFTYAIYCKSRMEQKTQDFTLDKQQSINEFYDHFVVDAIDNLRAGELIAFTRLITITPPNRPVIKHFVLCEIGLQKDGGSYTFCIIDTGDRSAKTDSVDWCNTEAILGELSKLGKLPSGLKKGFSTKTFADIPAEIFSKRLQKLVDIFNIAAGEKVKNELGEEKKIEITDIEVFYQEIAGILQDYVRSDSYPTWTQKRSTCSIRAPLQWLKMLLSYPSSSPRPSTRISPLFYRIYGLWLDIYSQKLQHFHPLRFNDDLSYHLEELLRNKSKRPNRVDELYKEHWGWILPLINDAKRILILIHLLEKQSSNRQIDWGPDQERYLGTPSAQLEKVLSELQKEIIFLEV